jgi:hypothetical protein
MDPAVASATSSDLPVTIRGDNFRNTGTPSALGADLDGILLATTYVSTTELAAVVPFSSPGLDLGAYTLTVRNPGPTNPIGHLIDAFSVYTYSTTCEPAPTCGLATGDPDGDVVDLTPSAAITIDLGIGNSITDGPGYDMVYYEWPTDIGGGVNGILLDMVRIELIDETTPFSSYIVFDWDGVPGGVTGTNIDAYATDSGPYAGEVDNEPIPATDLYPAPPSPPLLEFNTGIAIDIGVATPAGVRFRWVRITSPLAGAPDGAQIDSVVRLH